MNNTPGRKQMQQPPSDWVLNDSTKNANYLVRYYVDWIQFSLNFAAPLLYVSYCFCVRNNCKLHCSKNISRAKQILMVNISMKLYIKIIGSANDAVICSFASDRCNQLLCPAVRFYVFIFKKFPNKLPSIWQGP